MNTRYMPPRFQQGATGLVHEGAHELKVVESAGSLTFFYKVYLTGVSLQCFPELILHLLDQDTWSQYLDLSAESK